MTKNGSRTPNPQRLVKGSSRQHTHTEGGGSRGTGQNPGDGVVNRLRGHGDRFGQLRRRVYFFPTHIIGKLRLPSWRLQRIRERRRRRNEQLRLRLQRVGVSG